MNDINNTTTSSDEDNNQPVFKKAPPRYRILAFIIDHVIFTFVSVMLFFILLLDIDNFNIFPSILWYMFVIFIVYMLKDVISGRSIGKFLLGIAVKSSVDPTQIPSVAKLFLRNISLFIWPIESMVLLYSTNNTRLGDNLAKTDVYMTSTRSRTFVVVLAAFLMYAIFMGTLIFGGQAVLRSQAPYHVAINYLSTNPEIIELIGDVQGVGLFSGGQIMTSSIRSEARFTLRLRGSKGRMPVVIFLERYRMYDWEVVYLLY